MAESTCSKVGLFRLFSSSRKILRGLIPLRISVTILGCTTESRSLITFIRVGVAPLVPFLSGEDGRMTLLK